MARRPPSSARLALAERHDQRVLPLAHAAELSAPHPASELELPRLEKRLPKYVLTSSEVEQVMRQPNLDEPMGVRDRAILETLYSTGMRRRELMGLSLFDLDRERGTVIIRQGRAGRIG